MSIFYVYLLTFFKDGKYRCEAWAQPEPDNTGRCTLLFECASDWVPATRDDFLAACKYYKKVPLPGEVTWYGYVPF